MHSFLGDVIKNMTEREEALGESTKFGIESIGDGGDDACPERNLFTAQAKWIARTIEELMVGEDDIGGFTQEIKQLAVNVAVPPFSTRFFACCNFLSQSFSASSYSGPFSLCLSHIVFSSSKSVTHALAVAIRHLRRSFMVRVRVHSIEPAILRSLGCLILFVAK